MFSTLLLSGHLPFAERLKKLSPFEISNVAHNIAWSFIDNNDFF